MQTEHMNYHNICLDLVKTGMNFNGYTYGTGKSTPRRITNEKN